MNTIKIWTDGACSGKTHRGGAAAIIIYNDEFLNSETFSEENSTNQRMEIKAVTIALSRIKPSEETLIEVYTDSAYVCNCFNDGWWKNWVRNGWVNASRKPVANRELWEELLSYYTELNKITKVEFKKVKGHNGDFYNEMADKLAVRASRGEN